MQFGHVERVPNRAILTIFRAVASMGVLWRPFFVISGDFEGPNLARNGVRKVGAKNGVPGQFGTIACICCVGPPAGRCV